MTEDETRAAVDRFNDAFNRHDVDAVMTAMTDDCVFESTSPPHGERHEGQAAVRAAWEAFFGASPTAHFDAEEVIVTGDKCVVRWRYSWTDGGRSVLAEEIRREIFDGATPATRYLRGVVVEGDHGRILSGAGDSATLIEG